MAEVVELKNYSELGNSALKFILAGKAIFTTENERTGNRFTYKISKARDKDWIFFVRVLNGADNLNDYAFMGTIQKKNGGTYYKHSKKSRVTENAQSVKVIKWILNRLLTNSLPENIKIYHSGRCGRCGRVLTVPESITSGFGPECIGKI